jgi:hypothetical protein
MKRRGRGERSCTLRQLLEVQRQQPLQLRFAHTHPKSGSKLKAVSFSPLPGGHSANQLLSPNPTFFCLPFCCSSVWACGTLLETLLRLSITDCHAAVVWITILFYSEEMVSLDQKARSPLTLPTRPAVCVAGRDPAAAAGAGPRPAQRRRRKVRQGMRPKSPRWRLGVPASACQCLPVPASACQCLFAFWVICQCFAVGVKYLSLHSSPLSDCPSATACRLS